MLISPFWITSGLIAFASLLLAGRILDKNVNMDMNNRYSTTCTMYEILPLICTYFWWILFTIFAKNSHGMWLNQLCEMSHYTNCIRIIEVYVHFKILSKNHTAYHYDVTVSTPEVIRKWLISTLLSSRHCVFWCTLICVWWMKCS